MSSNNTTYTYQCEDSTDGILTAVYDAWASRRGHSRIKLQIPREADTMELFSEYIPVQTDAEKAEKVRRSILKKISTEAWEMVFRASLSNQDEKADLIYRFLIGGFYYGAPVTKMMAEPVVMRMTEQRMDALVSAGKSRGSFSKNFSERSYISLILPLRILFNRNSSNLFIPASPKIICMF